VIATAERTSIIKGVSAPITTDAQNEHYTKVLFELTESKRSLSVAEERYVQLLTLLIENYEAAQYPIRNASPVEVLTELMAANNLRQKDLAPVFGSESVVSAILHGARKMNRNHIERLSKRFSVSPALFF
jgi:HTH-type transcriptional regulator/antitoxin HigA